MAEIRVPTLGESVTEATIGKWFKRAGDAVAVDEPLVELETDKVTIEVPAPAAGVLSEVAAKDGETVAVGALLGQIKEGAVAPAAKPAAAPSGDMPLAPSVRKMSAESGVDPAKVDGSGKDGRVTKGDMMAAIERAAAAPTPVAQTAAAVARAPSPADDAARDGTDLIYKNYYHIGVAVGTEKGLVVPVVRDADHKSLAEIEKTISDFGRRARDGALKLDELQGGTFTISNGGVYGSLMSTPILNAPQSGILGMHKIQERPMAIAGKIEIRPMMYLALSYDHRIVDGREAVTFLVKVKESLEAPERLVLDL